MTDWFLCSLMGHSEAVAVVLQVLVVDRLVIFFWAIMYLALSQDVLQHITVTQRQASECVRLFISLVGGHCRLGELLCGIYS